MRRGKYAHGNSYPKGKYVMNKKTIVDNKSGVRAARGKHAHGDSYPKGKHIMNKRTMGDNRRGVRGGATKYV